MTLNFLICPNLPKVLSSIVRKSLCEIHDIVTEVSGISEANVVICQPSEYTRYQYLIENMDDFSIVTPLWAFYSSVKHVIEDPCSYSANPQLIFSGLTINIRHLDHCCMTDFYSEMIAYFGGRVIDDSIEHSTHTVMETKPCQSASALHHEDIDIAELASLPLNIKSINVFINAFFEIKEQGSNSASVMREDCSLMIKRHPSNHYVSYSWLDACIAQLKKLPEEPYYTAYKDVNFHPPRYDTIERKVVLNDSTYENRTNKSQPLKGTSFVVSKRISGESKKHLEKAAIWLGSLALPDMKDFENIETMNQHQKLIMIESKRHEKDGEETIWDYVTPYCISKLLRCGGDLGGVLDIPYPGTISRDLSAFLNLLYRPIMMNRGERTPVHCDRNADASLLWGKTFAISGFNELTPCNDIPCKYDIAAGVYVLGGHTANCMVEGLTTHLICETMNGDKYNVAKKWGSSKIKIVHWKWILQCLSTWTVCDIFEDENSYFAAESDVVSKLLVNSMGNENEKENINENIDKNGIKDIIKYVNDNLHDKERINEEGIGTLFDKETILRKIIEKEEDEEDEMRADEISMAQIEEVKVIKENVIGTLYLESIKKINENETDNEKLTDDSPYISVTDFDFYDSQTSHSQATSTGDGDDVYRSETLDPSIPHIPGENGMSVSEDDNVSDEIMIQKTDTVLKEEIVSNEGVPVVEEKRNGRAFMMSMQEEFKGDTGEEVEVIVKNVNVLETLHPETTSPFEMPQYDNTTLKLPITETTDAVVKCDVSQGYRFQFGGGDDEEMTYARSVVESLGGSVVTDDSCTHLVLWKITRTEKYLCACASGKVQCKRTFCRDTFHFSCLFSTDDASNKELIHINSYPSIISQWILRPLYLAVCFEAAKDTAHHNSRRFLDEVQYEWGAEQSLELLDENQKLWAMAGRRWRLYREILKPFGGENVLIIGVTAPPAGTLSRMVVCGGGKASIVEDMSFLKKDDIIFSDRTLIIAASKHSINGEDSFSELCLHLGERGVTALFKTPVYLLDALCGASAPPAYTSGAALINIIPSVDRPLQHKTPSLTLENVTIAPTQSKRRKISL